MKNSKNLALYILGVVAVLALPIFLQSQGNAWVRIADIALLYVMLSLGLNIVVGYAGLLDLGYVAFFAIGAYLFALMGSSHLSDTFPWFKAMFPNGLHTSLLIVIPLALVVAGMLGVLLGAPTLKLRGDYLAIVTLGFGEIIRVFLNNLDQPINITNGPKGITAIDSVKFWGSTSARHGSSTASRSPRSRSTTTCSLRWWWPRSSSRTACRCRASGAPGWRSAKTRSPPRPWASTPAT